MGFRFRKSIKLGKGVRLNVGKRGVGLSVGTKGARMSINSSGRKSATVGLPGTGLSYTANLSGRKNRNSRKATNIRQTSYTDAYLAKPAPADPWYRAYIVLYVIGAIFTVSGIWGLASGAILIASIIALLVGIAFLIYGVKGHRISNSTPRAADEIRNAPSVPLEQIQSVLLPGTSGSASWKQLVQAAQMCVPQWMKIEADSRKLVDETVNPEVFFSRYDLLLEQLEKLSIAENVISIPDSPSVRLQKAISDREDKTTAFINRSYAQVEEKSSSLKTERGKRNRKIKYYQALLPYKDIGERLLAMMEADGITLDECTQ